MTFFQWRRFNFFDLNKDIDSGQIAVTLKDCNVICSSSGRGQIVLGDEDGTVYFISCDYKVTSLKAFNISLSHVNQMKHSPFLVTIGCDEEGVNPLIKVWHQEKLDKQGNPMCVKICRAIPGNRPTPVSAVAVHENKVNIAVGFTDGSVVLYQGDISRNRTSKPRILLESDGSSVSGLAFKTTSKATHLFAVTREHVYSFNITVKDKEVKTHLDSLGCLPGCSVITEAAQEAHFMIGRTDAVYCYTPEGRGPCYAFDGEKLLLQCFRGYLIIVHKDKKVINKGPMPMETDTIESHLVTVFDTWNKFVAFSSPLRSVMGVFPEWGSLCVLGMDRHVCCLTEKDLQSKLALLFKKNLYDVAIKIAKSDQYDAESLVDIFRQYGDHLYSKGDHNGAIEQYIKTIGRLEPSYVIRKFLDAQRIHNLTLYLQALHKKGLATEDHTTLLLNCYTKLKDTQKLDEFIQDCEVDFDVETAIKVCRQAGYFKHALSLAKKHHSHQLYLKIQIEDHKDFEEALKYMGELDFEEAEENIKKYGSILLENDPVHTIEMLKRLCTDYQPSNKPQRDNKFQGLKLSNTVCKPEDFINLFVNKSQSLADFLESMLQVSAHTSRPSLHTSLLESHLHAFSTSSEGSEERRRHEEQALALIKNSDMTCDNDQALFLCQMNHLSSGVLYLYEKAKLYPQLVKYHVQNKDYESVLLTCKKFGDQDPALWVQALNAISEETDVPPSCLAEILAVIERLHLLPPLVVLSTLSPTLPVGVMKDYLLKVLQWETSMIEEDERLIAQYREETGKIRQQIHNIKESAVIFQGNKCSACSHVLELPSLHFLCQHSYHQRCFESFAENENECPACSSENKKILNIIKSQEQNKDLHEQFHSQLEKADDGFSVIAEYFGRGVFNQVTLIPDVLSKPKGPNRGVNPFESGTVSEARMRVGEARGMQPIDPVSESAMRTHENKKRSHEATSRSYETPKQQHSIVQPISAIRPAQRQTDYLSSSLERHITIPPHRNPSPIPPPAVAVTKQRIEENVGNNRFEEYDDSKNPFADDDKNPFAGDEKSPSDEKNPFGTDGDGDDYDKNLNPFA